MTNTIKEKLGLPMSEAIATARTERNGRTLCMPPQPFGKPDFLNDSSSRSKKTRIKL